MQQVKKAVITAAGLGTRLLPATKELPKEMLPLFTVTDDGIGLKPVVQIIFELLYEAGFREFCFIVGRGKRILEDHFTPDINFLRILELRGFSNRAKSLIKFYNIINESRIFFINQPEPRGFGHAVLCAEPFVGAEPFLLHAGDDVIVSDGCTHINRMIRAFQEYDADCVFLVEEVEDPRAYGVIVGKAIDDLGHVLDVNGIVEKPKDPPSNLAVVAVYIFKPKIFDYLRKVQPDEHGEIQLTDAIRLMIEDGCKVLAVKLLPNEKRLDVGTPEKYWQALVQSHEYAIKRLLLKKSTVAST